MTQPMLVFTSCIVNYLPKARVLCASLKKWHPDWDFCLLLGEKPPASFNVEFEPFDRLLAFGDLGIPDISAFMFKHRLVELCTAVKGAALNYFLETEQHPKVMYLDPDIMVFASLDPLDKMLKERDILLTPHQLAPQSGSQAIQDNEICSLRHGVFNLGFVAAANRKDGIAFSRFWKDRLSVYCRDDMDNGLFTDQKWCDLAPAYFPGLGIVRDPGCNAASWNLTDRMISKNSNGQYLANGVPLRFYHFTGHDSGIGRIMTSIYGANMPAVAELWQEYDSRLMEAGHAELGCYPWQGAFYSNGNAITDEARLYYRDNPAIQALYPNPYETDASGSSGFAGHWRRIKATEGNRLYVLARKPFRLAWLAQAYLHRKGGVKALPQMFRAAANAWRRGGAEELLAKIRKFKNSVLNAQANFRLDQLLKPPNETLAQWSKLLANAFRDKSAVLFIDHMYGGGANDYREKRISELMEAGTPCLLLTWDFFGQRLKLRFSLPGGRIFDAEALDLADILQQDQFRFGKIIVSELVLWSSTRPAPANHHEALPAILKLVADIKAKNSASLEIAVHDYYPVCPSYHLLENNAKYCAVPNDMARCRDCLATNHFNIPPDFDLVMWRKAWQQLFAAADIISVFSHASADILKKCFNMKPDVIHLRSHLPLASLPKVESDPDSPLYIGVIGHIAHHKGADIIRQMAKLLKPGEKLAVIGALDGAIPENIKVTGNYDREQLPAIIHNLGVNCCLVPSIWPETFCYVVQEIMQMELPLAVFPLGAQAERVAEYANGQLAEAVSAEAALAALRKLDARSRKKA